MSDKIVFVSRNLSRGDRISIVKVMGIEGVIQKYPGLGRFYTKFNSRLNKVNAKVPPDRAISRERLFRLKGAEWFGTLNIEIFKRFIGRSIFA